MNVGPATEDVEHMHATWKGGLKLPVLSQDLSSGPACTNSVATLCM